MFGLGTGEIVIILVLALILLGPQRLPEAAKQIGKGLRTITKATEDVKQQMQSAMYDDEERPRPVLAPTPTQAAPAGIPPGGVPQPAGDVVAATAQNVPGLDAALAEPAPQPAVRAGARVEPDSKA